MNSGNGELRKRLDRALARINELEDENSKLRAMLAQPDAGNATSDAKAIPLITDIAKDTSGSCQCTDSPPKAGKLTKTSASEEKVRLFKSLFRGREDVFAIRWTGKNNKSGYSPACHND
ncbi:MAG: hypothetical protein U1B83_06570, partial [Candidatus Cloacimonadaceae bacterium]|nr:hypothetical protein [Candidatus Cloacimonadaceae bacterium]